MHYYKAIDESDFVSILGSPICGIIFLVLLSRISLACWPNFVELPNIDVLIRDNSRIGYTAGPQRLVLFPE